MSAPDSSDRHGLARRLAALALGLALTFALFETALWIGHFVLDPSGRRAADAAGQRRILCVGDSNTYGIHLAPEDSYPGRLQRLLDADPSNPWRVVNLGYPGQNSAQVRGRLAENLEHYDPDLVICWIGVNNTWSGAMRHLWALPDSEPPPPLLERVLQSSRTLGMLRMLRNRTVSVPDTPNAASQPPDVAEAFAGTLPAAGGLERGAGLGSVEAVPTTELPPELEELERNLRLDLERIRALTEAGGARLVLVSYPLTGRSRQAAVNGILRRHASATGLPLVPAGERLLALAASFGWEQLLFPDHHATAAGNYAVARTLLNTLIDGGLLEERTAWRAHPPFEQWIEGSELRVEESFRATLVKREASAVTLELEGPPGWGFWVGVEALADRGDHLEPLPVAIAKEEHLSLDQRRAYFGDLDERGRASTTLSLPPLPAGAPPATKRWRLTANANPPAEYGQDPNKPDGFWSVVEFDLD